MINAAYGRFGLALDGDETLKEEPLLRGSNGLCVYKKGAGSTTLRLKDANGSISESKRRNWVLDNILSYAHRFGDH